MQVNKARIEEFKNIEADAADKNDVEKNELDYKGAAKQEDNADVD